MASAALAPQHDESPVSRPVCVIATYNERANIEQLLPQILRADERLRVLVVDDASPDGTATAVERVGEKWPGRVEVLRRPGKLGYGSAFVDGFRLALTWDVDCLLSMDADLSHDPDSLPDLIEALSTHDLAVGSRYAHGVRVLNWSLRRLALSVGANRYVNFLLRLGVIDSTSGYRGYRRSVLEAVDLGTMASNGYAFLVEVLERARFHGFRVVEVPIVYADRHGGVSKMDRWVIFESALKPWQLLLRRLFRRLRGSR
jgi:dolichol-phosphate mannosyltransferase